MRRARLYREAGADIIFPEALVSAEEFARFAREVPGPLLANMTEFGRTPYLPASAFRAWGYRLVIYPVTTLRVAMKAVEQALRELAREGTQAGFLDRMQTRDELYELLGYAAYDELANAAAERAAAAAAALAGKAPAAAGPGGAEEGGRHRGGRRGDGEGGGGEHGPGRGASPAGR